MSRAIRLTRIHALNWYGYKDSIPVEGNLLLAGLTGSGKSILMDLIQIVLVGDQRLVRFNQSATGDRSDRTLKGYALGDTKHEENGVTQYMRNSAISYVALEFTWPKGKNVETWGLRVEFASAAEVHGRVTPFLIPAQLNRADFLDADRKPLELAAFKALAESKTRADGKVKGRLYPGLEEYLRDMAHNDHLNFDRSVLRGLLPTAMSFTFLKSFNDFCRHFILPADRLDVSDVTASYRTFLRYESDLKELNDQFARLGEIRDLFTRQNGALRDKLLARWLEADLRHRHSVECVRDDEQRLAALHVACAAEESRLEELVARISERRTGLDQLKTLINETPEGKLYSFIKSRNAELARKVSDLQQAGSSIEQALGLRVKNCNEWVRQLRALPFEFDSAGMDAVEQGIREFENGGVAEAAARIRSLQELSQKAALEVSRAVAPVQRQLGEIRAHLGSLREEVGALKIGKLPFPTRLLDALNKALPSQGGEPAAQPLCKLCEIVDERWRPAIEVTFTRKFAVVVAPEHYDAAEKIYHQLRDEARGESLIHPGKALKLSRALKPGSLAEKLEARNPVARAVLSQLFGDLVCVERREELRDHDYAILPDGFTARGAFVDRARHYDNLPFIGKRGLEQQLLWKEKLLADLEAEERKLRPLADEADAVQQRWRELFETIPHSFYQDLARAQELPAARRELDENIAKLNTIDRARFDDLAEQQAAIERELPALETERRALDRSEKRVQIRQLEAHVAGLREEIVRSADRFQKIQAEADISPWTARIEELRAGMLARQTSMEAAAGEFNALFNRCDKESVILWEKLCASRRDLALAHPRFDELVVEAPDNDGYEKQLARLAQSDIPDYREKAERERRSWEGLFRRQVLEKLRTALFEVETIRTLLNGYLKSPIGINRYQIRKWQNPDFRLYHRLLDASAMASADDLFFASADAELRDAIGHFLSMLTDQADSVEAARLLDYRHYYEYDMEVEDLTQPGAPVTRVDKQSGKFSGGENQSPYFIAILASYLRAYKRHDSRRKEPSLGIVPIDEAFSKLSGERIKDCIRALKSLDLQGIFSMSTGNIPYAFEHCDSLVVVAKEERRIGKKTEIRNVPVTLSKDSDEARRLVGNL
ncbi:MAG: hypothetical protein JWL90_1929 [Chthoniobacteraceae bacterium]|nr:hypothetical protein [Chthoniobacteraceae bacterium]